MTSLQNADEDKGRVAEELNRIAAAEAAAKNDPTAVELVMNSMLWQLNDHILVRKELKVLNLLGAYVQQPAEQAGQRGTLLGQPRKQAGVSSLSVAAESNRRRRMHVRDEATHVLEFTLAKGARSSRQVVAHQQLAWTLEAGGAAQDKQAALRSLHAEMQYNWCA